MSLAILSAKLKEQRTHGLLDRHFPIETGMLRPYAMEEEGTLSRTPLVCRIKRIIEPEFINASINRQLICRLQTLLHSYSKCCASNVDL
jgi:hypothetical protein